MTTNITEEDISKGQACYSKNLLSIYDLWVVYFSNRFLWRCPKNIMIEQYKKRTSMNHLDIGVGTGYYLKKLHWQAGSKLSLMDLNKNSLLKTSETIKPVQAYQAIQADIFKPQTNHQAEFDSISMNYLLHCLPGNLEDKSDAIKNAVEMLKPNGTLFGATIIGDERYHHLISNHVQRFYQRKGIFSNQNDNIDQLEHILNIYLENVSIKRYGAVVLFSGQRKQ